MIADIFYPIFTLKIIVLACLMQKKIDGLAAARASFSTTWWVYSSPHTPSCKKKNNDASIFFLNYPLIYLKIYNKYNGNKYRITYLKCK